MSVELHTLPKLTKNYSRDFVARYCKSCDREGEDNCNDPISLQPLFEAEKIKITNDENRNCFDDEQIKNLKFSNREFTNPITRKNNQYTDEIYFNSMPFEEVVPLLNDGHFVNVLVRGREYKRIELGFTKWDYGFGHTDDSSNEFVVEYYSKGEKTEYSETFRAFKNKIQIYKVCAWVDVKPELVQFDRMSLETQFYDELYRNEKYPDPEKNFQILADRNQLGTWLKHFKNYAVFLEKSRVQESEQDDRQAAEWYHKEKKRILTNEKNAFKKEMLNQIENIT